MIRWEISSFEVVEPGYGKKPEPITPVGLDWEPFQVDHRPGHNPRVWVRRCYDDGQPPFGVEPEDTSKPASA